MLPLKRGDKVVSILPMAHMYGLAFEFLYEFSVGCHIYYLTRMPSPKIIFQAFAEVKPNIVISVPLIIEKIIKKNVLPKLETPTMKLLLKVPFVNDKIKSTVREQIIQAFGGNFSEVVIGGAAFNQEVEQLLKMIDFPYTVGYGMTECGPIICYEDWKRFKPGSCGKAAPRMEVKIDSPDPEHIPGEIICRGPNVMLGYYKNPEATAEVLEPDGWLHTGDLALMDSEGNVTIKGRSKNLLLGPNGQNIYPEEIEDKLNNLPYVAECIVVQQNDKLVGLVYPDFDDAFAHGLHQEDIERIMEENRQALNLELPAYCQVSKMKIYPEEFEKTPKKSIKTLPVPGSQRINPCIVNYWSHEHPFPNIHNHYPVPAPGRGTLFAQARPAAGRTQGGINLSLWKGISTQRADTTSRTYLNIGVLSAMNRLDGLGMNLIGAVTRARVNGVQLSGLANVNGGSLRGLQAAGINQHQWARPGRTVPCGADKHQREQSTRGSLPPGWPT